MRFDSFSHLLRHWAAQTPDSPALLYDEGGVKTLSFAELLDRVERRAEELRRGGKTCLGVLSDGSMACVTELFAANFAGLDERYFRIAAQTPEENDLLVAAVRQYLEGRVQ